MLHLSLRVHSWTWIAGDTVARLGFVELLRLMLLDLRLVLLLMLRRHGVSHGVRGTEVIRAGHSSFALMH